MTAFKYRFVRFGTRFTSADGPRPNRSADPAALFENELAVDVGSICWGLDGETLAVLDHHFHRPAGQFPSAAAAVLHNAHNIRERLRSYEDEIWLVSHQQPDFDAFSAMYLARQIVTGDVPAAGWEEFGICKGSWCAGSQAIDWFQPRTDNLPPNRRWPVLLAANAACVDHCRRMSCPKNRSLHSILYAALLRGRNYASETNGAFEFFEEARQALLDQDLKLNPLHDSVLEGSRRFAPELALLDREADAYRRDIARARKSVVFLQSAKGKFADWYGEVAKLRLLEANDQPAVRHLRPWQQSQSQADGIYLRDPECLLFKEWVRNDLDNSSMGAGFLFSAIAYTNERPRASANTLAYYFSLDPERAGDRHLYNVWTRLESAEIQALRQPEQLDLRDYLEAADEVAGRADKDPRTTCRAGFADRAGPELRHLFDDPWFDGSNYNCTIVVTPDRGTFIGRPGKLPDLGDDPIVRIVQQELEDSVFVDVLEAYDLPSMAKQELGDPRRIPIGAVDRAESLAAAPGQFRFASVPLREDADILRGKVAEQIGRTLWRFLEPEAGAGVPTDFFERHLFRTQHWVGVWSRRGMIVAYRPEANLRIDGFRNLFADLITLTDELRQLVETAPGEQTSEQTVEKSQALTRRLAEVKHRLSLPENRLLGRFFESSRLDEVLGMLRDVNENAVERVRAAKADATLAQSDASLAQIKKLSSQSVELQGKVEWLEVFFVAVYFAELFHIIGDSLRFNNVIVGVGSLVGSIAAGGLAVYMLHPWKHAKLTRLPTVLFFAALLLAAYLISGAIGLYRKGEDALPVLIKGMEVKEGLIEKETGTARSGSTSRPSP